MKKMNMKPLRFRLSIVLMLLTTVAFAQSDAQKSTAQSEAQKSFDKLKTLAGTWQGLVSRPAASRLGQQPMWISLRVTSRGNAFRMR